MCLCAFRCACRCACVCASRAGVSYYDIRLYRLHRTSSAVHANLVVGVRVRIITKAYVGAEPTKLGRSHTVGCRYDDAQR